MSSLYAMALAKALSTCMLMASAMSTHDVQDAASSCGAATLHDSSRCLMQQQHWAKKVLEVPASETSPWPDDSVTVESSHPLQDWQQEDIVENFKKAVKDHKELEGGTVFDTVATSEEKANWTGEAVTVEFMTGSPDLQFLRKNTFPDYDVYNTSSTIDKEMFEVAYTKTDGGQIVSDDVKDKFYIFGFTNKTAGMSNSCANRVWTGKPWEAGSTTVSGVMMTNAPGNKNWKYSIEFVKPVPEGVKMYPANGYVGNHEGNLYVVIFYEDPLQCADGEVVISSVTFTPDETEGLQKPEEVLNGSKFE